MRKRLGNNKGVGGEAADAHSSVTDVNQHRQRARSSKNEHVITAGSPGTSGVIVASAREMKRKEFIVRAVPFRLNNLTKPNLTKIAKTHLTIIVELVEAINVVVIKPMLAKLLLLTPRTKLMMI
jgi:hypothetical protein